MAYVSCCQYDDATPGREKMSEWAYGSRSWFGEYIPPCSVLLSPGRGKTEYARASERSNNRGVQKRTRRVTRRFKLSVESCTAIPLVRVHATVSALKMEGLGQMRRHAPIYSDSLLKQPSPPLSSQPPPFISLDERPWPVLKFTSPVWAL